MPLSPKEATAPRAVGAAPGGYSLARRPVLVVSVKIPRDSARVEDLHAAGNAGKSKGRLALFPSQGSSVVGKGR